MPSKSKSNSPKNSPKSDETPAETPRLEPMTPMDDEEDLGPTPRMDAEPKKD